MRWLLPFIFFWCGYGIFAWYMRGGTVEVPQIMGMQLNEALHVLAEKNLTLRLLDEQEDGTVPAGTVMYQFPQAGRLVKSPHSLSVVVAKRAPLPRAPRCYGMSRTAIQALAQKRGMRLEVVVVDGVMHMTDTCFAQLPVEGEEVGEQGLLVYVAGSGVRQKIMPDVRGKMLADVVEFFSKKGWSYEIVGEKSDTAYVTEQRPLAGSFIDDQRPLSVKLKVALQ